jgi:hypothetical protein
MTTRQLFIHKSWHSISSISDSRSVGTIRLRTKGHGVCFFIITIIIIITMDGVLFCVPIKPIVDFYTLNTVMFQCSVLHQRASLLQTTRKYLDAFSRHCSSFQDGFLPIVSLRSCFLLTGECVNVPFVCLHF